MVRPPFAAQKRLREERGTRSIYGVRRKGGPPVLDNPQTLNRYSYVQNNPLLYLDPEGNLAVIYHRKLTYETLRNAGFSSAAASKIARASVNVDLCCNSEEYAHIHAQAKKYQTPKQAQTEHRNFVDASVGGAALSVLQGDFASADEALGQAFHAMQDTKHEFAQFQVHTGNPYNDMQSIDGAYQLTTDINPKEVPGMLQEAADNSLKVTQQFEQAVRSMGAAQGMSNAKIELQLHLYRIRSGDKEKDDKKAE